MSERQPVSLQYYWELERSMTDHYRGDKKRAEAEIAAEFVVVPWEQASDNPANEVRSQEPAYEPTPQPQPEMERLPPRMESLEDGYYVVKGHHHKTGGIVSEGRWVGVKVVDSYVEWVSVEGPRSVAVSEEAKGRPVLESCTGTGGVAAGPGGPGYTILPPGPTNRPAFTAKTNHKKKKTKKKASESKKIKKDEGQVILGDTDETETHEEQLLSRLTNAISDGLLEQRRHLCIRCGQDRTFAEAEGDRMRCIVCSHSLFRADSHFSVIKGKGMYSPPASKKAIREAWRPGMDIPEDIDPTLLAKAVAAGGDEDTSVGVNARLDNLKKKELETKDKASKEQETDVELEKLAKKLEQGGK